MLKQQMILVIITDLTLLMATTSSTLAQPRRENRPEQDQRNDRSSALIRRIKSYDKNDDGKSARLRDRRHFDVSTSAASTPIAMVLLTRTSSRNLAKN